MPKAKSDIVSRCRF